MNPPFEDHRLPEPVCDDCGQYYPCQSCGQHFCCDECAACGGGCQCYCSCPTMREDDGGWGW